MKTTKADFKKFKEHCRYYQKLFGLVGYELFFTHEPDDNRYSWIHTDDDHNVTVGLSTTWDNLTEWQEEKAWKLKDCARHEMLHLLLSPMARVIERRFVTDLEAKSAEEEVLHLLEYILGKISG